MPYKPGLSVILEVYVKLPNKARLMCWSQHAASIIPISGSQSGQVTLELSSYLAYAENGPKQLSGIHVTIAWSDVPLLGPGPAPAQYTVDDCKREYDALVECRPPFHRALHGLLFGFYYMNGLVLPGWMYCQRLEAPVIQLSTLKQCVYMGALRLFGFHDINDTPMLLLRASHEHWLQAFQCAVQAYAITVPYRSDVCIDLSNRFRPVGTSMEDEVTFRAVDTYDECRVCKSGDCEDKGDTSLDFFNAFQALDTRSELHPGWSNLLQRIKNLAVQYTPFMALVDTTNGVGAGHMTMCALPAKWFASGTNTSTQGCINSDCGLAKPFLVDTVNPSASFICPPDDELTKVMNLVQERIGPLSRSSIMRETDAVAFHSFFERIKVARLFTNNFILNGISNVHTAIPAVDDTTYGASLHDILYGNVKWIYGHLPVGNVPEIMDVLSYRHPPVTLSSDRCLVYMLNEHRRGTSLGSRFTNMIIQKAVYERDRISVILTSIFENTPRFTCIQEIYFQLADHDETNDDPIACVLVHFRW